MKERHANELRGRPTSELRLPARGRSRGFRGVLFAALLAATGHLVALQSAFADGFERLLEDAGPEGTVPALVTGWRAITGDEAVSQGSRGDGPIAITGDEFVRKVEGASGRVSVSRRYDNFPVLAMEMDASALRAAKTQGQSVEIWEDVVLYPQLEESTLLVGAPNAWRDGFAGQGLAVAILDTGVDTRHPFLAERTVFEACFSDLCPNGAAAMIGSGAAFPVNDHGTHVAGIVLGGALDEDLAGVGPELRLVNINVFNPPPPRGTGRSRSRDILAGLDLVLNLARFHPGSIGAVNMSFGAPREESGACRSTIWDHVSRQFDRAGIPVVVASGNHSEESRAAPVSFPACVEGFVSVGAVTKSERVASFSNSGPALDLLAPGVDILSSVSRPTDGGLERGFESMDGTSMAAPHVAAAMALLKQASPESSVAELLRTLKDTGRRIRDPRSGVEIELIDVGRSIGEIGSASGAPLPPLPAELTLEPAQEPEEEKEDQWQSITG